MPYASIIKRFVALFVDGIIVFALVMVFVFVPLLLTMTLVVGPNHETLVQQTWYRITFDVIGYGLGPAYEILFVGVCGATPGKMLLGIKVVASTGGRVSYARAIGRCFGKVVSWIIGGIGFLLAFWDPERRAFHDMMCGTRVIDRER